MSTKSQKVKKQEVPQGDKFSLHVFREHSQELFGVKPEVLDGAFLYEENTELTKADAHKRINDFLEREVKQ